MNLGYIVMIGIRRVSHKNLMLVLKITGENFSFFF